ncbi:MAG: hypothetical protein CVV33_01360 [Methanomicrobiales archaeon HGW-Methanomicrobiales-4]|nr:MAG: hypothetical protein CVV33_01360 [Methanomicrobiales archaeon HGW-Methanomicrobiales-4]
MPIRHHFELRETIATILADREGDILTACQGMEEARRDIERYILSDPFFRTSFEPVQVKTDSELIHHMADSAGAAGVGPMATVAGAVAYYALCKVRSQGSRFCVIDNGGDIALITDHPIKIGLYAGESPLSGKYAFLLGPFKEIYGVCTSSATVGHSMSLGNADSVTVFGPDPILIDAVATAVCNELTPDDHSCFDQRIAGVDGIFAVFGEKTVIWGNIPLIISAHVDEGLITAGRVPRYHDRPV